MGDVLTESLDEIIARWRELAADGDRDAVVAAAERLLATRGNEPAVVSVATTALVPGPGLGPRLGRIAAVAGDGPTATKAVAERLADAHSIGVVSSGPLTTEVLQLLMRLTDDLLPLVTDRPSVVRGLAAIGTHPLLDDPATADRLLLPAVAVHGSRVWSSAAILETADRATTLDPTAVLVHARPLTHLDDRGRRAWLPPAWVDDAADERWSLPYRPSRDRDALP